MHVHYRKKSKIQRDRAAPICRTIRFLLLFPLGFPRFPRGNLTRVRQSCQARLMLYRHDVHVEEGRRGQDGSLSPLPLTYYLSEDSHKAIVERCGRAYTLRSRRPSFPADPTSTNQPTKRIILPFTRLGQLQCPPHTRKAAPTIVQTKQRADVGSRTGSAPCTRLGVFTCKISSI